MSTEGLGIRFKKTLCFLISGHAGVGKSFSSDLLSMKCTTMNLDAVQAHFATDVKKTAMFMGWDGKKDLAGRILLQGIGQLGRAYDPFMWVRKTFNSIEEHEYYPFDVVLIDDWRFINEFSYINTTKPLYKVIKLRIESPERELLKGTDAYNEVSETELDGYDFDYVINNSTGFDIYNQLEAIFTKEVEQNLR